MALPRTVQSSFSGGEISPQMYARVDMARYLDSLKLCRNFIPRHWGGIDNRPGTEFIQACKLGDDYARLIPFIFNDSQSYSIEFGNLYCRFYRNGAAIQQSVANCIPYNASSTYSPGDWVVSGGVMYYCIAKTQGNIPPDTRFWSQQTVYEIVSPYAANDISELKFTQSADVMTISHQEYAVRDLSRFSDNDWTITPKQLVNGPFQQINTNTGIYVYASANTGNVNLTSNQPLFLPGHVGCLFRMDEQFLQGVPPWEADKQIATGANTPLGVQRRSDDKVYQCATSGTPGGTNEWRTGTLAPTWDQGTQLDGDGNQITSAGTVFATKAGVEWTYLHSQYGICVITQYVTPTLVEATVLTNYLPDSVVGNGPTLTQEYNGAPPAGGSLELPVTATPDGIRANWLITLTYEDGATFVLPQDSSWFTVRPDLTAILFNGQNTILFYNGIPYYNIASILVQYISAGSQNHTNEFYFGSFASEFGFPAACGYFQDRLAFAGTPTEPQTAWLSKTSQYVDFGESTPIVDDDAVSATAVSRKINLIQDMLPLQNLILLTSGAEMAMFGDQNGIVSPSAVDIQAQSYHGISKLRALPVGNTIVYCQARGSIVRDLIYQFELNGYTGNDLTVFAFHLVQNHVLTDTAYAELPYYVMWFVRDDGVLLSCTYLREQQILAWAHHDTNVTNGDTFESVCVVPEGSEDAVYFIVRRFINGAWVRYVERLTTRAFTDPRYATFLDACLSFDGTNKHSSYGMTLTGGVTWENGEVLTLTASGAGNAPFTSANVGDEVSLTSGTTTIRALIIAYTNSTNVTVRSIQDVPAGLQGIATSTWSFMYHAFHGMTHLIGQQVNAWVDGSVQGPFTVAGDGSVTLSAPGAVVCIGLPIQAQAQPMDLNVPYLNVYLQSLIPAFKSIPKVNLIVDNTRGLKVGNSFDNLYEIKDRWTEDMGEATFLYSGQVEARIDTVADLSTPICMQVDDPVPCTILGLLMEVSVGT